MKFEKEIKKYILKNKDIPVLTFDYEKLINQIQIKKIIKYRIKHINILKPDLLPAGYPNTIDSSKLKKWIEKRKIPQNREYMENILNFEKLQSNNNFMDYIDVSYGLSLNDSFWIIPDDKNEYKWENYNLYKNKFNKNISLVALGINITKEIEKIKISPEYTTEGMLAKCWTIFDNKIKLLKKSSKDYNKEAYAEYYMCQIAEIMGFEHIKYDLKNYYGNIVSSCSLFTTEDIGFVPMYYCMKPEDLFKKENKLLEAITKIYGIEKMADLMIFDSLIYNTDRHLGNFGMLVDNNTRKILKPAPIFDNGNSILAFLDNKIEIYDVLKYYTSKFDISFNILSNIFVQKRHKEGLEKLKNFKFKKHQEFNLENEILEKAEEFIQKRAKFISNQLDKKS